jgi:peroxiredoxin
MKNILLMSILLSTINFGLSAQNQTLQSELDVKKAAFEQKASDEKKRIYKEGLDAVSSSGILNSAKKVGDTAPDFKLNNATGKEISLIEYVKSGPVILTWYRGGWCPYCNITLARLQKDLPLFKAAGAQILALTPELPDSSLSTKDKHKLEFEILSDVGNKVAKNYGVVFQLTPAVAEIYQKSFGLHEFNGDDSNELPLAATYIIDQKGIIQYAFVNADYRNRAEPAELLKVLNSLKK